MVGVEPDTLLWWQDEPERFAIDVLGIDAWGKYPKECQDQLRLFKSIFTNRRTACQAGHKTGKSFTLAAAALTFLVVFPNSKVITTAPTGRQVDEILWQEIRSHYDRAKSRGLWLGGNLRPSQSKLTFAPGWYALGFATDERGGGVQAQGFSGERVLFILDEACGVGKDIWDVADTAMQSDGSRLVACGNPVDPATAFYDACTSELFHTIRMSSLDSPNMRAGRNIVPGAATQEWCDERPSAYGGVNSPDYLFRVLGQFPEGSEFSCITLAMCERAMAATIRDGGPKVAGCDVARFGSDKTVVIVMNGGQIIDVISMPQSSVVDVAGLCARLYREHDLISIAIDDTGVGGGVTDILGMDSHINVLPVNFGSRAYQPDKYDNKVTEMFFTLAEDLEEGNIGGMPHGPIIKELTARQYKYTKLACKRIESKDDFKKRIGRSPDMADALLLANYARRLSGSGVNVAQEATGVFV